MKFAFMKSHAHKFKVDQMAQVLAVSRAGYYQYLQRKPCTRALRTQTLLTKIKQIHQGKRRSYGSPRVYQALLQQKERCSRKYVAKIMRQHVICSNIRKRWKKSAYNHYDPARIAPNLLAQNFTVRAPNLAWVADITYIWTREGWLYLAVVIDLFSRKVVGSSASAHIDTTLVLRALEQAICHRQPGRDLIHHSDRGSQYSSDQFRDFLRKCGIQPSMSAKGHCYDNAVAESFFHTLKAEHANFYEYASRAEAAASLFEYIEVFYNRERIHSTLNYVAPAQFEQLYCESRVKLARPAIEAITL